MAGEFLDFLEILDILEFLDFLDILDFLEILDFLGKTRDYIRKRHPRWLGWRFLIAVEGIS